ncbi:(-)-alpha-terpineol synthase isoform X2 [Jatropha curcas]|uniref:(-)-alpha-terpineol synthase isoform X2 n=1 Tax=Jatropha curcas TaxID=180498 RepID=UPI0018958B00|nr:(-)-alpha-terpineol synthase isoform X2 [Jatropha curcas]
MRIEKMKEQVKMMIEEVANPLEIIDTVQRLGLAHHFEDEIQKALKCIYSNNNKCTIMKQSDDLYATALEFRLLRQQGYDAPQEVFSSFKDEEGNFRASLCDDLKGLVYLYEASYLSVPGETILEEARDFASKNILKYLNNIRDSYEQEQIISGEEHVQVMLARHAMELPLRWRMQSFASKNILKYLNNIRDSYEQEQIISGEEHVQVMLARHAMELPLRWRMQRADCRWFIDVYESSPSMNPTLLHFAKLDFNMVQAIHQQDLKHAFSWWKKTGLGEKLGFVRGRPMEVFLWAVGGLYEPQYAYFRRILTRVGALVTVVDDIYDVYGTFDELQLFSDAVERWDIDAMDQLPQYMKICFLTLYNSINEIVQELLVNYGLSVLPYLKREWTNLCKSYLLEAKWYHDGYTPTLEEYLQNGFISISAPLLLVHAYFTVTGQITEEVSKYLEEYPDIIRYSSLITRLADDLGTSSYEQKRGDNSKSIQCYMHETESSEEEARKYIHYLIGETWKKINEEQIRNTHLSQTLMKMGINLARMSQCMYQHGDGFGVQNVETKNYILSLLVQPICL